MNNPLQILLVEDDPTDLLIAKEALESSGIQYELHTVGDGEAALNFLKHAPPYQKAPRPHLVFLDMNLPRLDGREVLAEVKAIPQLSNIPFIVLSTSDSDDDVTKAYCLQASCYLVKPCNLESFTDMFAGLFRLFTKSLRLNYEPA